MIDIRTDTELLFAGTIEECRDFLAKKKELERIEKVNKKDYMSIFFRVSWVILWITTAIRNYITDKDISVFHATSLLTLLILSCYLSQKESLKKL